MKADEARHADHAEAAGARVLPPPIPRLMALTSRVMKAVAYRLRKWATKSVRGDFPRPRRRG